MKCEKCPLNLNECEACKTTLKWFKACSKPSPFIMPIIGIDPAPKDGDSTVISIKNNFIELKKANFIKRLFAGYRLWRRYLSPIESIRAAWKVARS